jgi:hypothetical protein
VSHGPVRIVAIGGADAAVTTERGNGKVPSRLPVSGMQIPFRELGLQARHWSMDIPFCKISHDNGMLIISKDLRQVEEFPKPTHAHLLPDATAIFPDHRLAHFAAEGFLEFFHVHHQSVHPVLAR